MKKRREVKVGGGGGEREMNINEKFKPSVVPEVKIFLFVKTD